MLRRPGAARPTSVAAAALAVVLAVGAGRPGPARAQQLAPPIASYRIEVRLDPDARLLHGSETLTWVNDASVAVPDLWFHLYQNAFLNESSTWVREAGGFPDRDLEALVGYTDLHALRLVGEGGVTDLLPTLRWRAPDDGNPDDRTVFSVELPEPLPPGAEAVLEIEFTTKLSPSLDRSGIVGDYYMVTQWFPKIAVFEDAGERGATGPGWNAHQFHRNGEFYADFGHYEVRITLPEAFVVGATGRRTETLDAGDGLVTHVWEQSDVHDFAWTAWPRFEEIVRVFDPDAWVTDAERREVAELLGVGPEELRLSPVEVTLLVPPSFAHHADRHLDAAMNGLEWFGLWYGAYPYETLTIVVPADGITGGGMEYPTFFTTNDLYPLRWPPLRRLLLPEQVTVHEFGHQYWYGLVASNETEEAWLDEGFNSYSTAKVLTRAYGSAFGELLGVELDADAVARAGYVGAERRGVILQPSWTYPPGGYSVNSYAKPELVLRTLERTLGEATFGRALRTYFERWRFRHPTSRDFFDVVEETCGCDLAAFWEQAVLGSAVLDYAVTGATVRRVQASRGRFERDGEWRMVEEGEGGEVAGGRAAGRSGRAGASYLSRVTVQRQGDFVWPVEVALRFEDGSEVRRTWDGRAPETVIEHTGASRLERVLVDPDRKLPLDVDWLDNTLIVRADPAPRRRWALRWLFWMTNLLMTASGLP